MLSLVMLCRISIIVILNIIIAECHYAKCRYADCWGAKIGLGIDKKMLE
jgi:hypothetical protein